MLLLVPAAVVGGIILLAATTDPKPQVGARTGRVRVGRKQGTVCEHFPWLPDEVDEAMAALLEAKPHASAQELLLVALERVYPVTPGGKLVQWPASREDCLPMHAIQSRVGLRAAAHHAHAQDQLAEQAWYGSGGR